MPIFQTTCTSLTGPYLYSDTYIFRDSGERRESVPLLNKITAIPVIGHFGAIARIVLSIIHMIGHTLAAFYYWNREHLYHVAKGGAEFVNGVIELMPIVGRMYVWYRDSTELIELYYYQPYEYGNYFLIKIYNPHQPDAVDKYWAKQGTHPYFKTTSPPHVCEVCFPDQFSPSAILENITAANLEKIVVIDKEFVDTKQKGDCFFTKANNGWDVHLMIEDDSFIKFEGIWPAHDQLSFEYTNYGSHQKIVSPNLKEYFDFQFKGQFYQDEYTSKLEYVTLKCTNGYKIRYDNPFLVS